jgi:hypothetical protein
VIDMDVYSKGNSVLGSSHSKCIDCLLFLYTPIKIFKPVALVLYYVKHSYVWNCVRQISTSTIPNQYHQVLS